MIIKHYKGYISIDELSDKLKTNRNGTSAYNIIQVAKEIGFEAVGIKTNLDEIKASKLILPCIAHVTLNKNYMHYVVIYEINFNRKYLIIGDPQDKVKRISFNDFSNIWNNILLTLYPVKNIPINKKYKLIDFLVVILKNNKSILLKILLVSILLMIFSISSSFYSKYIFDNLSSPKDYLLMLLIIFSFLTFMKNITEFIRTRIFIYFSQKLDLMLVTDVFNKIISLPYHYYRNRTTGEIVSRVMDLNTIKELVTKLSLTLMFDLPLFLISSIIIFIINPNIFFLALTILFIYILVIYFFNKPLISQIDECQKDKASVTSQLVESIDSFETIKGLHIENAVNSKFESNYTRYCHKVNNLNLLINIQLFLKNVINDIGQMIIVFVGVLLVIDSKITIGTLIMLNTLIFYFLNPIKYLIELNLEMKQSELAIKRTYEIIQSESLKSEVLGHKTVGNIEIANLKYAFNVDNIVLDNVNIKIEKGSKVIITGKSGSGKSTLIKILMKYYKVSRGMIKIDGFDLNDINVKKNICYISQNENLFTDSLYNNILLNGNSSNLLKVSNMCYVDEIINNNQLGYNMLIEENGFNLSGGQKQRVVLARTLLRRFDVLLIDEGLNQIDVNLERKILKNIFSKFKNKTIVIVSHRLENIDLFDQFIEIKNGKVVSDVKRSE